MTGLQTLAVTVNNMNLKECDTTEFLKNIKLCFSAFEVFLQDAATRELIDGFATEGRLRDGLSSECWSDLRHDLYRLRTYSKAVRDLVDAEKEWPELFQEFEVIELEASKPETNILGSKVETAKDILSKMSTNAIVKGINEYQELARSLQPMGLDERIQRQCVTTSKCGIKPYVHSEILVLEWVISKYHGVKRKFYKDFRYIGSSKGACKLCRYYFETPGQHMNIKTRPSHGNVYSSWRFPDLWNESGRKRRQAVYNHIIDRIRADAFETLESKSSEGKRHDSSSRPLLSVTHTDRHTDIGVRDLPSIDELGEDFQRVDLSGSVTDEFEKEVLDEKVLDEKVLDEKVLDEEVGGVKL